METAAWVSRWAHDSIQQRATPSRTAGTQSTFVVAGPIDFCTLCRTHLAVLRADPSRMWVAVERILAEIFVWANFSPTFVLPTQRLG